MAKALQQISNEMALLALSRPTIGVSQLRRKHIYR